jgi:hypothetical protein
MAQGVRRTARGFTVEGNRQDGAVDAWLSGYLVYGVAAAVA